MNNRVKEILCNSIIHIDIGKRRCAGDEDVYEKNLRRFAGDLDYSAIVSSIQTGDYYKAGLLAQRLKIKAYNLGMVRLAKSCDALSQSIQAGKGAPGFESDMRDLTVVYGIMRECIDRAFAEETEKPPRE
ncbi:MAG: hypothetical protein VB062_00160 [Christensenella sp.]|nr:hypothetical protein [Christensenella sp.]